VALAQAVPTHRQQHAARGKRLEYFTIAWNSVEGLIAVAAGAAAGSISLVGFGVDSFLEVASGSALLWRIAVDADECRRERSERSALRFVGVCFLGLAAYVAYAAVRDLMGQHAPAPSLPGILLACASLIAMPLLSRAKRRVGTALGSAAMQADARQAEFCTYLSGILLGGLLLNTIWGLWWADPVAALVMVPIIAKEGIDGLRSRACC
jgi:divalent metal cation (Fe/Co/Zn/Cd) transporter